MGSAYESADLILKLYELRREDLMRKAREWYTKQLPHANEQLTERVEQFKEARVRWEAANKTQNT